MNTYLSYVVLWTGLCTIKAFICSRHLRINANTTSSRRQIPFLSRDCSIISCFGRPDNENHYANDIAICNTIKNTGQKLKTKNMQMDIMNLQQTSVQVQTNI